MSAYFVGKNYDGLFIENSGPELIYSSVLVTVFKGCQFFEGNFDSI